MRPRNLLLLVPFLGCAAQLTASERQMALERSQKAIDPSAEPAPPQAPPPDGRPAFNTEYYLGSEQTESHAFGEFGRQIQVLQMRASSDNGQPIQRGFHAKAHGCLHGELRVRPQRDPRTRYGIFASDTRPMPVWVRFSNGVGWKQSDDELDARGMAVKVMGVPGKKYIADEAMTQDFLMTNSPTPVGADAAEFMKFARANVEGRLAGLFFLAGHIPTAAPALTKTNPIDSSVTTTYWSGGAYHLGAHQAVKFQARPCAGTPERHPSRRDPDYLAADLAEAAKGGVCFTFYVQFQVDPEETPIENASVRWDETLSVPVPVADVAMPPQAVTTGAFCEGLSFTPWHSIAAHEPMGNINRARRVVYAASQLMRHFGPEPKPWPADPPAPPAPTSSSSGAAAPR